MSRFVHLHVHSDYSLLDGAASIDALVDKAVGCGMSHLALTDHGSMFGAVAFHDACRARGVVPLVGSECYLSRGSRHDRGGGHGSHDGERASRSFHMGLLARNETGYRNLMQLSTIGYTEGFYYRPRDRRGSARRPRRRPDWVLRLPGGQDPGADRGGPDRRGHRPGGELSRHVRAGQLLPGVAESRAGAAGQAQPGTDRRGAPHGDTAGRHQRRALRRSRRRARPGRADLHRHRQAPVRHRPPALRQPRVLLQGRGRDAAPVRRRAGGGVQHRAGGRALPARDSPSRAPASGVRGARRPTPRNRTCATSPRSAWPTATPRSRRSCARASTTNSG